MKLKFDNNIKLQAVSKTSVDSDIGFLLELI